jgi:hypothetical protein
MLKCATHATKAQLAALRWPRVRRNVHRPHIGWFRLGQGAVSSSAAVGALLVLFIWNRLVAHRVFGQRYRPSAPLRL